MMKWRFRKEQVEQLLPIEIASVLTGSCACVSQEIQQQGVSPAIMYKDKRGLPHSSVEQAVAANKIEALRELRCSTVNILRESDPWFYHVAEFTSGDFLERLLKYKEIFLDYIEKAEEINY